MIKINVKTFKMENVYIADAESDTIYFDFNKLPENIVLHIFGYLQVKNILKAGRVCKRWQRLANDKSLWRHVDLTSHKLTLNSVWKMVRAHATDALCSLHLRGHFQRDMTLRSQSHALVSDALWVDIAARCPKLRRLSLVDATLHKVSSSQFPPHLTDLRLEHCNWPPRWLTSGCGGGRFGEVTFLDVSHSRRIDQHDVDDLCQLTQLTHLNVNGCYRLQDSAFNTISSRLTNLHTLEMRETGCTNNAFKALGLRLTNLHKLDCGMCSAVNDEVVFTICTFFHQLENLCISDCAKVTDNAVPYFANIGSFKKLDMRRTGVKDISKLYTHIELL